MYYLFSSYNHIALKIAAVAVILFLTLYPVSGVLAQETPTDETATTTEAETTTEETAEPATEEPTQESTQEPTQEPTQTTGGPGDDGGDGGAGADGGTVEGSSDTPGTEGDGGSTESGTEPEVVAEETTTEPEGDTTVDTGDATSEGTINNYIDYSELQTLVEDAGYDFILVGRIVYDPITGTYHAYDEQSQAKLDKALEDGILDPWEYLDIITPETDTIASTTNDAVVENEADIGAETGNNSANGNDNVTINTGDATAVANVLNVVNTNIFDSEGFFLFLDNLGEAGVNGNLDFRDFDFFDPAAVQSTENQRESADENPITAICPTCGGAGDLTINTGQSAEITNDVVVRSGTGVNEALENSGDATINTGDAYAAANVINLANTNIVDSNYLLLTFNNFGDYNNDIVFPSANEFLDLFATGGGQTTPQEITAINTNTTDVDNNADVSGATGDNAAEGDGDTTISTGDASADTNVLNQLNSNLFGGASFSILVKVHGEWNGDVVGAPEGIEWRETPEGIELYYEAEGGGGGGGYDAAHIINDNSAKINNNIEVIALTGENKIEGAGGDAAITTGDAYAAANVINVANTNVIGKNWLMAVINIFGDWNGNISFGLPNLWVGAKVDIHAPQAGPGTELTYEYTVMNTGDAPAQNVCLRNRFDHRYLELEIVRPTTDREVRQGDIEYCIGTIEAGEVREFSRNARVSRDVPYGTTFISNDIEVVGAQEEEYLDDNYELVTFDVVRREASTPSSGVRVDYKPSPKLTITKTNSAPFGARASSTVNYTIIIKNEGPGSAYNAKLIDTLMNEEGDKLYEETWNLEEILPGEKVEVMYTTFFNDATEPGIYTNYAHVEALGGYHTFKYGYNANSPTVGSSLAILPSPTLQSEEEVIIEVVEESVEIEEYIPPQYIEDEEAEEETIFEKVISLIPLFHAKEVQGPLYGPNFIQHPVFYHNYLVLPDVYDHPLFTQHPIFIASAGTEPQEHLDPYFSERKVDISIDAIISEALPNSTQARNHAPGWQLEHAGAPLAELLSWPFKELSLSPLDTPTLPLARVLSDETIALR